MQGIRILDGFYCPNRTITHLPNALIFGGKLKALIPNEAFIWILFTQEGGLPKR